MFHKSSAHYTPINERRFLKTDRPPIAVASKTTGLLTERSCPCSRADQGAGDGLHTIRAFCMPTRRDEAAARVGRYAAELRSIHRVRAPEVISQLLGERRAV